METIKTLGKRFKLLFIKMISIKHYVFVIATVLKFMGLLNDLAWCLAALGLVSMRMLEKVLVNNPYIKTIDKK